MILLLSCVLPYAAALTGEPWLFAAVLPAAHFAARGRTGLGRLLGVAGFGRAGLFTVCQSAALLLLPLPAASVFLALTWASVLLLVLRAKEDELHAVTGLTRNVPMAGLRVPRRSRRLPSPRTVELAAA
ncbi:hypothetical protein, partial [Actinocorallia lasiicapitis]